MIGEVCVHDVVLSNEMEWHGLIDSFGLIRSGLNCLVFAWLGLNWSGWVQ